MKCYKIFMTNEALSDMEQIYSYIAYNLLSPDTAMKQYNRIADAIFRWIFFPRDSTA